MDTEERMKAVEDQILVTNRMLERVEQSQLDFHAAIMTYSTRAIHFNDSVEAWINHSENRMAAMEVEAIAARERFERFMERFDRFIAGQGGK